MEMTKSVASSGRQENRKQGPGTHGIKSQILEAPGQGLGIAKAKKDESPWIRKGGAPSSSELFSALLCIILPDGSHAPRDAKTGLSMLYHPTATMKVAQGPHSPASISASHAKLLAQGQAHVLGSGCTAAWKTV